MQFKEDSEKQDEKERKKERERERKKERKKEREKERKKIRWVGQGREEERKGAVTATSLIPDFVTGTAPADTLYLSNKLLSDNRNDRWQVTKLKKNGEIVRREMIGDNAKFQMM